jgi:transposase-like protein
VQHDTRRGCKKKPDVQLSGKVESDECYVVAGQKGQSSKVKDRNRKPRRRKLKGKRGRGTSGDEKNPILGLVERGGLVRLQVLDNVQQKTIMPIITTCVSAGSTIFTDEYNIYNPISTNGGMRIRWSTMGRVSMPVMKTVMAFAKCMVTPLRGFGRFCAVGYAHTGESAKRSCRFMWAFSNTYTPFDAEEKRRYINYLPCYCNLT